MHKAEYIMFMYPDAHTDVHIHSSDISLKTSERQHHTEHTTNDTAKAHHRTNANGQPQAKPRSTTPGQTHRRTNTLAKNTKGLPIIFDDTGTKMDSLTSRIDLA